MDFTPYLGWIDVPDPNNPPAGARMIGAADLLRYESALRDTSIELGGLNARFASKSHTHAIQNVTGLQTALDGKASTASVNAKISISAGVTVVRMSTAGDERPSGANVVLWIGASEPTNGAANDLWVNSSTGDLTVLS